MQAELRRIREESQQYDDVPRDAELYAFAATIARTNDRREAYDLSVQLLEARYERAPDPLLLRYLEQERAETARLAADIEALLARANERGYDLPDVEAAERVVAAIVVDELSETAQRLAAAFSRGTATAGDLRRFVEEALTIIGDYEHGNNAARRQVLDRYGATPERDV